LPLSFIAGGIFIRAALNNSKGDAISNQTSQAGALKIDYFLYSCFEFEQTCKAFPNRGLSEQRWPMAIAMITQSDEHQADISEDSVFEWLSAALRWYSEEFPELKTEDEIKMENIAAISNAAVFFALDLKIIASKSLEGQEALANETSRLWDELRRIVANEAPAFASPILAYLRWSFIKIEEKIWEPGERPPVGRYTPGARRSAGRPQGGFGGLRRGGPAGRPGDRDRGPRRESGDRDKTTRGGSRDRDGGPRGGNRDRSRTRTDGRHRGAGSHADQEAAAVETVKTAIDKLRADTSLAEVRLDPSNSFFRRLQHKKAVADGFFSYSTGEGANRSVVVTRDRPANEDTE
jgi:hypothetical protein